ncbi:hypothetical protein [Mycobacterium sp. 852002-40037_SCH5390672]|uniref:hypothetical protein n=1 Tax=Mycobacterium sp. 852002-40037_SCH5390672 TaxID=1834089 RepID=UPI0008052658|nr:hypothetical protein [Mycobacterium sp. 852002-40037_SCH5390672]OBB94980.1 hypothetical protein A5782_08510 [Mycobacterium sp. 852002-40037_SCH5390672]
MNRNQAQNLMAIAWEHYDETSFWPTVIRGLRAMGYTWSDIMTALGFDADQQRQLRWVVDQRPIASG